MVTVKAGCVAGAGEAGKPVMVIGGAGGRSTVILKAFVAVCRKSLADTVKSNDPAAVGVPDNSPLPASIEIPVGKAPELIDHRKELPPAAASVCR
jgi:hypothetical protein